MKKYLLLLTLILLVSCKEKDREYQGDLPDSPINLQDFNTSFDDFNSTGPTLGRLIPFCFSTNRNSNGNNFDVIYQPMNVSFEKSSGILTVTNEYSSWETFRKDYEVINKGIPKINSPANELGPNLIMEYKISKLYFTILYATDISGNFQICFTSNNSNPDFSEIKPVTFLNSPYDDLYPAFNSEKSKIYFCSNREGGQFDIYYSEITNVLANLESKLSDTSHHQIFKDTIISSGSNDKCPFLYQNTLIFASNRPGGFGGYDLYYCTLENNSWSNPINFGETINSGFDEYRPILLESGVSETEKMMIFSSNRTGGKGGYDLYFVGVKF